MNKNKLFQWSIVAALAGFIFGFDTVVISGANLPIKELWHTSPLFHGFFIMSMALWGTVVGRIFWRYSFTKIWKKKVLLWIGILLCHVGIRLCALHPILTCFPFSGLLAAWVSVFHP